MTNHVHLILEPRTDDGLSIMMQCLQSEYARSQHARQDLLGHLWRHHYRLPKSDYRTAIVTGGLSCSPLVSTTGIASPAATPAGIVTSTR